MEMPSEDVARNRLGQNEDRGKKQKIRLQEAFVS
jgi:hypothetical protein